MPVALVPPTPIGGVVVPESVVKLVHTIPKTLDVEVPVG